EPAEHAEAAPGELPQELLSAASAAAEPEPEEPEAGWPVDDGDTETDPWVAADLEEQAPEPAPAAAPPEPEPERPPSPPRLARHRIDPFDGTEGRRWPWQRRAITHGAVAELPPLPRHP